MNILIVNPPHLAVGSRLAGEHLPPLGLLSIAGPLLDAGHVVNQLDADYGNWSVDRIVAEIGRRNPEGLLLGHSGSTSAQPIINEIARSVRAENSSIRIVVGGVFPTFHWEEILRKNPSIDVIVRGEGEEICRNLIAALENGLPLKTVQGIAYRVDGIPVTTSPAPLIENLDDYRVAWELMDGYDYTYWGRKKAAVVQFSRGCPYPCVYCGQSLFWKRWRHRDPQKFADELEMLHREFGIEVFNFADENMSSNPTAWREFLEALAAKNLKLTLVGSIRTDNIVRDAEILPLYKKVGFERFLLGIEHYEETVLQSINKASAAATDREAIQLLRKHGILSMATYVVGFGDERIGDFFKNLKQLLSYDPDQIQLLFVTPHRWTPFFERIKEKEIILTDQRKWDYKHQVIANDRLPPWLVFLCVKLVEVSMQVRPKALYRLLLQKDPTLRRAMRWYTKIGRRVWFWEFFQFFFVTKLSKERTTLEKFWE